jgi:hypothetical protein
VFVDNAVVNETDSLGLWITLNLPATPFKCAQVNAALDAFAVGHNQTLLDHWRAGSGSTMTLGFDKFDFLGTERRAVLKTAFQKAATLGTGAKCGQTVSGSYNLSQPSGSNKQADFYISPMIYDYRFWWECDLTAHKTCLCGKCLWITLGVKCNYHALDRVDFWANNYDIFIAPPYKIYDQLVRACNPTGRGFDVKANDASSKSGVATCSGTVLFPKFPIP